MADSTDHGRRQQIQERVEKATAGPWEKRPGRVNNTDRGLPLLKQDGTPIHAVAVRGETEHSWAWITTACEKNVDFIANARQDIPWLLSRVGELETEIAALREQQPLKPLKQYHNKKFAGQGFGSAGPYRVVVRTDRKTDQKFIEIVHDDDAAGVSFTKRQAEALLPCLQNALASVGLAVLASSAPQKEDQ